jgi:hypothetical protein
MGPLRQGRHRASGGAPRDRAKVCNKGRAGIVVKGQAPAVQAQGMIRTPHTTCTMRTRNTEPDWNKNSRSAVRVLFPHLNMCTCREDVASSKDDGKGLKRKMSSQDCRCSRFLCSPMPAVDWPHLPLADQAVAIAGAVPCGLCSGSDPSGWNDLDVICLIGIARRSNSDGEASCAPTPAPNPHKACDKT